MSSPDLFPDLSQPLLRRTWLRRFVLPALAFAAVPSSSHAFEWKIIQQDGRDYVRIQDIKTFYKFPRLQREGRNSWLRSNTMIIKFSTGAEDIFINNVKFCLSFPTTEKDGAVLISRMDLAKLLDPIIRPTYIENAQGFDTVVIDAGHGGHDSGATGSYGQEKAYTLDTCFRLEKRLKEMGYKTLMTRRTDIFLTLGQRVAIANKTPRCIFVSVHYNAHSSSAIGFETFALAPQGTATTYDELKSSDMNDRRGNQRDSENIALATAVHANSLYKLRSVDRGVSAPATALFPALKNPAFSSKADLSPTPPKGPAFTALSSAKLSPTPSPGGSVITGRRS